ncbi:hypothetical protein TTHERM_00730250 (macronuclear) [Tetrahymena thermophila SB210]|uniref:Serine protease n=1 Tax=Tetrahymena thermophila (strain SB210) TaxID=312017 RepID=Q245I8_TETTS|nr:hypothetical protein TTHERM_00730250 [Tetrahymena thermophila SB210]EAS03376.3 hypothetical protein TTHERM_00730250 [Tetrahymena thermophila SB210]|eukprot:XP_001023621.3 hypothetical protein TTHERM_00730250 [Tetrahymena thermophila SB210]
MNEEEYQNKENTHPNIQSSNALNSQKLTYFQQKATFYLDEDTKTFSQTFQQNAKNYKLNLNKNSFIHFWPNYPIRHQKLLINNFLPKQKDNSKIKPLRVNLSQPQIINLEQKAQAVGQVFVVYVEKSNFIDFLEISCATFSVVEFQNQQTNNQHQNEIFGLTVAHVFMDTPQNTKGDYYRLIFVSMSEIDTFEDFKKSLQTFKAKKRRQIVDFNKQNGFNIKDFSKLLQNYLQEEDKYFKGQPIFQAFINYEFLEYRRELISVISESETSHQFLLDPLNGLQCLPSIDCCLLSFEDKFIDFFNKQKIYPLQISQNQYNIQEDQQNNIYMIGYQQIIGSIFQKKDPTYILNMLYDNQTIQPIEVNKLINPHKSLQVGQYAKSNNYILTFEASTTQGSSGSPVLDINGNLIGINTGYFDDITGYEDTQETQTYQSIINFDRNVKENQSNYHKIKNYNCGIDTNHIIFQAFSKREISIFQTIQIQNPSELRKSIPPSYNYQISNQKQNKQKNK